MTNKLTKYGLMIIAAVLLVGVMFAGTASADATIEITNATGTFSLVNIDDVVYGDFGNLNGTVTLKSNGTGADGLWELELDDFKASNSTGKPIIHSTGIPNLSIELSGDSHLSGNVEGHASGVVITEICNLTITNQNGVSNPTLTVENLMSQQIPPGDEVYAINNLDSTHPNFNAYIAISNVNLKTITNAQYVSYGIRAAGNLIIDGQNTVVDVYTKSSERITYGLASGINTTIKSAQLVNVTADGAGGIAILGSGVLIGNLATVNAHAQGTLGIAEAIKGSKSLKIDSAAKVTAIAEGKGGNLENPTSALYSESGDLTITGKSTVDAHANSTDGTAISLYVQDLQVDNHKLLIDGDATVNVSATSGTSNAYAIYAKNDMTIGSATLKNTIAVSTGEGGEAYCMYANNGKISITDSSIDKAVSSASSKTHVFSASKDIAIANTRIDELNVTSKLSYPIAIHSTGRISITDSTHIGKVISYAGLFGAANGFWASQDIAITDSTIDEMNATSYSGESYAINTAGNLSITNSTINKLTSMCESRNKPVTVIYSQGNISITDSNITEITATGNHTYALWGTHGDISATHIRKITAYSNRSTAYVFFINQNLTISDSTIEELKATSNSGESYAIWINGNFSITDSTIEELKATSNSKESYAIFSLDGDLIIGEGSILYAEATGTDGYAMVGRTKLNMTKPTLVSAIGTTSSFAYYYTTSLDIDSLEQGYRIVNATYPETPIGFTALKDEWKHDKQIRGLLYYTSNYTSVLIAKEVTVTLESNGGSGGSTSVNVTCGSYQTDITNPGRDGYTFAGWFNQSADGVKVIDTEGCFECGVSGYTDDEGMWIRATDVTLYAHWTANPKPTPSSSTKDMGSTVILTEPVTPTPVPTATPGTTAVPTIATVKPTQQQTSKSPAPFVGLIAGLGAAAVLFRQRK